MATAETEIPHRANKNCDWSCWPAYVFSYKFVKLVEIVDSETTINKLKNGNLLHMSSRVMYAANLLLAMIATARQWPHIQ